MVNGMEEKKNKTLNSLLPVKVIPHEHDSTKSRQKD